MSRLPCASHVAAPLLGALAVLTGLTTLLAHPTDAAAQTGGVSFGASATAPSGSAAAPAAPAPSGSASPAPAPSASAPAPAPTPPPAPSPGSGGDTSTPPEPDLGPDQGNEGAQSAEWVERDRNLNESNSIMGGTGLIRTQHAETGSPGQLRIQFVGEGFSAGFLCSTKQSCPNPSGGNAITSDSMSHVGGTLSAGASLVTLGPGTLDAYAAVTAYANSDSQNKPELLQVLGDMDLGIKYAAPVATTLHVGAFMELWLVNGTGSVGLSGNSTSAKFGALVTEDLRELPDKIPLRFSLNGVYYVDNTAQVVSGLENTSISKGGLGGEITRIERYGLGISRVDEFDFLPGLEAILAEDRVRPFIEAKVEIPVNRQGFKCNPSNPNHDFCMAKDQFAPTTLTFGSRFFPWKRGFNLMLALDVGVAGMDNFIDEMQPIPPWMLYFGAGWAVDTEDRPPVYRTKVVEKIVEKMPAPRGHVIGFVHETNKNDPIVGAILTYRDHPELAPLATGADGKFGDDLPPGQFTYDLKADGFKPGSCDVTVPKGAGATPTVNVDCPLDALPRVGKVSGHVRDADSNQAVASVPIVLTDAQKHELRLTTDGSGGFKFDGVAPGTAGINVTADGYLVLVTPAEVKAREEITLELALRPKPKVSDVALTKTEIQIKHQVQFALDSSVILPESFGLLTEVADIVIRHPDILRIEVQGHTDNSGTAEHNKVLSEQRAEAVRVWLLDHGVPAERLTARGYGQEKPLVPNVTGSNRAKNRRVQFIILEREGGGASPSAPGRQGF